MMKFINTMNMEINEDWKIKNKVYLSELQSFLDKVENVKDEDLRREIIIQMLKCDEELTKTAELEFIKYYEKGKKC